MHSSRIYQPQKIFDKYAEAKTSTALKTPCLIDSVGKSKLIDWMEKEMYQR